MIPLQNFLFYGTQFNILLMYEISCLIYIPAMILTVRSWVINVCCCLLGYNEILEMARQCGFIVIINLVGVESKLWQCNLPSILTLFEILRIFVLVAGCGLCCLIVIYVSLHLNCFINLYLIGVCTSCYCCLACNLLTLSNTVIVVVVASILLIQGFEVHFLS